MYDDRGDEKGRKLNLLDGGEDFKRERNVLTRAEETTDLLREEEKKRNPLRLFREQWICEGRKICYHMLFVMDSGS